MADIHEDYSELFAQYFWEENFDKCEEVLSDWERYHELDTGKFNILKASLLLFKGEIEEGKDLLEKTLNTIHSPYLSDSMKNIIKKMIEQAPLLSVFTKDTDSPHVMLCKRKQPKGVSFRYWFGVGQVLVGCAIAPFNPAAGVGLIVTGVGTVVHAGADCLDNMEEWEKEFQNRQRMGKRNISYIPEVRTNYYDGLISA